MANECKTVLLTAQELETIRKVMKNAYKTALENHDVERQDIGYALGALYDFVSDC